MKKEARLLLDKAVNSLTLSIELFNRPTDVGRVDAVLLLLDHSFEMLLKAAILHRGGRIREPRATETIGFDKCVRVALSDGSVQFLSNEQALLLQAINEYRDAAQHHLVDMPEGLLYTQAQAGLTLFGDLLSLVFGHDLQYYLPVRVLPISTEAPTDIATLFALEAEEIVRLLAPGTRRRTEAIAKTRSLAILDRALSGEDVALTDSNLLKLGERLQAGVSWEELFPGVAAVDIRPEGSGPTISIRVTKKEGVPVHLVPEGTPGASVVAVRRVTELDFYSLGHSDLADHVGLTAPRLTAVIWRSDLKADLDYAKEITIGSSRFWRYSQRAIGRVNEVVEAEGIDAIWADYRGRAS
ncbi:MAG: hypothetical protein K1X87_05530 [Dehalococcoidia bacterium]|nr:hypothetical protein [Dehalococcoidia bacterium]